ncbi:hypothetical protein [Porphyrobacter sp. MBR-49]
MGDAGGVRYGLQGEAVAVPLPNDKVLFALLRSDTDGDAAGYHVRLMQNAACREGQPSVRPDPSLCGGADRNLFLSILAMDSYNRAYGQGVILNAGDSDAGQAEAGRKLGKATILNVDLPSGAMPAGFYAIAYDMTGVEGFAAGEKVISCRGTDNPPNPR